MSSTQFARPHADVIHKTVFSSGDFVLRGPSGEVEIMSPARGVYVQRYFKRISDALVAAVTRELDHVARVHATGGMRLYINLWNTTAYDPSFRKFLTHWLSEHRAAITEVHVLYQSSAIEMAILLMQRELGEGFIVQHKNPISFDAALNG